MLWREAREKLPHRWLVVEAVAARQDGDERLLDDVNVIEVSEDGWTAMARQSTLQREQPAKEFHSVHTDVETPVIRERPMVGVRGIRWNMALT